MVSQLLRAALKLFVWKSLQPGCYDCLFHFAWTEHFLDSAYGLHHGVASSLNVFRFLSQKRAGMSTKILSAFTLHHLLDSQAVFVHCKGCLEYSFLC